MRRLSTQLIATRREPPADAQATSHQLMARAGMLQQAGAGLFTVGPLLLRVLGRIQAVIREELDAIGCQEVRFPHLQPPEPWRRSGRWAHMTEVDPVMLRTVTRGGAELGLGPTQEEQATLFAAEQISSHRQLPQTIYQITTKFRDEPRPRSGLLRTREFTMKDAYSFDVDEPAARATYHRLAECYERIFERVGLDVLRADADVGAMGGKLSAEFLAPATIGEDFVAISDAGSFRANAEVARAELAPPETPPEKAMTRVETPGATTMEVLQGYVPDVPTERMIKTLLYQATTADGDRQLVAALVRGDRSIDEGKLAGALGASELAMADAATIREVTGAEAGYAGPVGLPASVRVVGDHAIADVAGFVCGGNATDTHYRDVWWGRDASLPELADLDRVTDGDQAPDGGTITLSRAIEAGHVFLLGTRYTAPEALDFAVTGEDGVARPVWMGCFGIGVERLAAALVEQHHDDAGIAWPTAVAPHTAAVVPVRVDDETQRCLAERVAGELDDAGVDVALDDREARPGVKFADLELIGIPWRITVGRDAADGRVELAERAGHEAEVVDADTAAARVIEIARRAGALDR
jgi:prolyl-tRNA synthetase